MGRSIEDDWDPTKALRDLETAAPAEDDRGAERYDDIQEMIRPIRYDRARAKALRDVAKAMAQAGDDHLATTLFEKAQKVARSIEDAATRWEALRDLAAAMAQAGRHEEAREVARSIRHDEHRAEALKALSAAMARTGRLNYALSLLGLRPLDEFLQILAEWSTVFEQIKPRLSIAVLSDATADAGWVSSDWREIHELLSTPERR